MKTRNWMLLLLCLVLVLGSFPVPAHAEEFSGQCGPNLTWSFDSSTGKLTITGSGAMYSFNFNRDNQPWASVRQQIRSVSLSSEITGICANAFDGCTALSSVNIPNGIGFIGANAFANCTGLTSVTIPGSITAIGDWAFSSCTGLSSIVIPEGTTEIGSCAFSHCTGLKTILIPSSVEQIGYNNPFFGSSSLTAIQVASGNNSFVSINGVLFSYDKTKLISYPAGKNVTAYAIPSGVAVIGANAFRECTRLSSVTIPNSVTSIQTEAFYNCVNLTSVTLPNSLISINGGYAFAKCTKLTSITIPSSLTDIPGSTFAGCTSMTEIKVDSGNDAYISVNGVLFMRDKKELVAYPSGKSASSYTIPNGVVKIQQAAFQASNLTSVVISNSVTTIGWRAFAWSSLSSVTLPASISTIQHDAFYWCNNLKQVNYKGTAADKAKIDIENNNDSLLNAAWQYGDAPITVTLNANGGTCATKTLTVNYGQPYGTLPTPAERTGYNFDGWWTAKSGGKQVTATTVCYASGNFTLYARWKAANTYTVTLSANGLVSPSTITVTYGNSYGTLPTPAERTGYHFAGWWTTKTTGGKQVTASTKCYATGNFTLYARWEPAQTYTVTLNPNGGTCTPTSITVTYKNTYGTLPTPTRRGYKFAGWWTTKTTGGKQVTASTVCYATGNFTLYARWTALASYTVTLNPNGGSCSTPNITVYYSQAYGTLPTPTRTGYKFAGWWTTKTTGGKQVTASTVCYATGNFTLYARWTALASYTVTLNPNGGSCSTPNITVYYSQTYGTLPTPTRRGYKFAGWWTTKTTGGKQVTKDTVCYATGNFTLYARWTALASYTITLNPNGGSCSTPNITVYYSQIYGTLPTPTRTGYKFAGWWTTKTTGGKQVTKDTVCKATGNFTLYARWTKN